MQNAYRYLILDASSLSVLKFPGGGGKSLAKWKEGEVDRLMMSNDEELIMEILTYQYLHG